MRTIISAANKVFIFLAVGLICVNAVQAQIGSSISADGSAPNDNAMLDVQSPATGAGKGMLIPRVSLAQRTTANAALAGGLLDNSGNLRGGAAQGLIIYQTDGSQGLYFNTSLTATPAWAYLGDVAGLLASNVWAAAGSTTNYLPRTGGTMSGTLNMGAQIVSNVAYIDFNGADVSVGSGANGYSSGVAVGSGANGYNESVAVGCTANGTSEGAAVGFGANGRSSAAAMGWNANGYNNGAAVGWAANAYDSGAALGALAKGTNSGAALGYYANGSVSGAAVGYLANGFSEGATLGWSANGSVTGVAVGASANGNNNGAAIGRSADGSDYGAAVGRAANGSGNGAAVGRLASGYSYGAALGQQANGYNNGAAVGQGANGAAEGAAVGKLANGYWYGAAVGNAANGYFAGAVMGYAANGTNYGVAVGYMANGAQTNVAIGMGAKTRGGTQRIAIGNNVTNYTDNSVCIRGTLYLDGGTGIIYRSSFGTGGWTAKAFTIDHPLDPENKILRHFCLEGPQVWNVYAGNVQLVNGQAVVELPDYYSALNLVGSEIYSLTPIGGLTLLAVGAEVSENQFTIIGDKDVKVSWTIKVLRNDPGCREDLRRRPVEQMKSEIR